MYWGEWISDPPGPDPCDCDGNWTGHYRGHDPVFSRLRFLWAGYRYHGDCGPGCASCGGGPPLLEGGPMIGGGPMIEQGPFFDGEPVIEDGAILYEGEHGMVPYESAPVILPDQRMVPRGNSVLQRSALRRRPAH